MSDPAPRNSTREELFAQTRAIEAALRQSAQEAISRHKRLGESIVIWRDGRVVVVPPEEIVVPDDESAA